LFEQEFRPFINQLDLDHRLVIELPNPLLGKDDPLNDPALWYHPSANAATQ
jgi:hypothetical protein